MKNEENLILMYRNYRLFSFHVDYQNQKVKAIEKLEDFDNAPKFILDSKEHLDYAITKLVNTHSIPPNRTDYEKILEMTGCRSGFELSFQGHGLSLSNHFWYLREGESLRYEDINFFTNPWDDSFARAILNVDFESLKHCDLNVPDVTTNGWGSKGWISEKDGPKLYKLGINKDHSEEPLAEVAACKLAKRLFNDFEVLDYELKKVGNRYASVSPVMINIDEDLLPLYNVCDPYLFSLYHSKSRDKEKKKEFFELIKQNKIPGLYDFFVRLACLKDICFVSDLHFGNIGIIQNYKTGEMRLAPIYDLGGAFGSSKTGQNQLVNLSKSTYLIIYYMFNDLEPDWDYSWYDSSRLVGAEEMITSILQKSDFYSDELINKIIEVFRFQKNTLDNFANKKS